MSLGGLLVFFLVWQLASWMRQYKTVVLPATYDVVELSLLSKQTLIKRLQSQTRELETLALMRAERDALSADNALLRAELGRIDTARKGVVARVVSTPQQSLYDSIRIDAGIDDGVTVGQTVYAFGGSALGTISDVAPRHSQVLLFSAPGREVGMVVASTGTTVTALGRGGGEYELNLPRDMIIADGDVLTEQTVTSAPLAVVQKILVDPRDPFQRVFAKIPINVQTISWVRVQ